jgi:Ras family protein T1
VTNQGLEDEIAPIMREFKVSAISSVPSSSVGGGNRRRVLGPPATQHLRGILLCTKGCVASHRSALRLARTCKLAAGATKTHHQTLKPKCLDALKRIFKISDVDKDGLLSAHELNQFQVSRQTSFPCVMLTGQQKCFSTPLQSQELEGILDLVRSYDPSLVQPVPSFSAPTTPSLPGGNFSGQLHQPPVISPTAEGVTEMGFLYLHTIFIQQGRMETTWTVLRNFGYGEGLDLREDFLLPK